MGQLNSQTRVGGYMPITEGSKYSDIAANECFRLPGVFQQYSGTYKTDSYLTNVGHFFTTTTPKYVFNKYVELPLSPNNKIGTHTMLHKGNISDAGLSIDMVDNLHVDDTTTGLSGSTKSIWSSIKTMTEIQKVKNEIIGGADETYNTLKEIQDILNNSQTGLAALLTKINSKLGKTEKAADSNLLDGLDSTAFSRMYNWLPKTKTNTWCRVAFVDNADAYQNKFIFSYANQSPGSVGKTILLVDSKVQGTNSPSVTVLGLSDHSAALKIRFVKTTTTSEYQSYHIEVYQSSSNVIDAFPRCQIIPIHTGAITTYTSYTAGEIPAGASAREINCQAYDIDTIKTSIIGNSTTANTLRTARTINNVSFNGSSNISIPATNTPMTGYVKGSADTAIIPSDNVSTAIGKLEFKADNRVKKTGDTMTGDLHAPQLVASGAFVLMHGNEHALDIVHAADKVVRFAYYT